MSSDVPVFKGRSIRKWHGKYEKPNAYFYAGKPVASRLKRDASGLSFVVATGLKRKAGRGFRTMFLVVRSGCRLQIVPPC